MTTLVAPVSANFPPFFRLDPEPPPPWHAVRTRWRAEFDVAKRLEENFDLEVYCPRYLATRVIRYRKVSELIPYLSGIVFARWDADDPCRWHDLMELTGVTGFIGGTVPATVPEWQLDVVRRRIGPDDLLEVPIDPAAWRPDVGTHVRVIAGPFEIYTGQVESVRACDGMTQVKIWGLLGRDVSVPVPASMLERIDDPDEPKVVRSRRARKRLT